MNRAEIMWKRAEKMRNRTEMMWKRAEKNVEIGRKNVETGLEKLRKLG